MSTDFVGEAEGPWTRWGPRVLAKEFFYQLI